MSRSKYTLASIGTMANDVIECIERSACTMQACTVLQGGTGYLADVSPPAVTAYPKHSGQWTSAPSEKNRWVFPLFSIEPSAWPILKEFCKHTVHGTKHVPLS